MFSAADVKTSSASEDILVRLRSAGSGLLGPFFSRRKNPGFRHVFYRMK